MIITTDNYIDSNNAGQAPIFIMHCNGILLITETIDPYYGTFTLNEAKHMPKTAAIIMESDIKTGKPSTVIMGQKKCPSQAVMLVFI